MTNGAERADPTPTRPWPFAVDVRRRDHVTVVQPRGELDLDTVERLRAALDDVERPERMVLDLRGLSFIGSTGLRLLIELHDRAKRDGFELTLIPPPPPTDRAIRLSGLDRVLPFGPPVEAVTDDRAAPWPE